MNKTFITGNRIVDEVATIDITGNIIPMAWFKTMTGDCGKPMLLPIFLLSDIVYWYKPKEVRDEITGEVIGYEKRFKADLLQRSYKQIESRFGVSKKQARTALDYLCNIGVIKKHLRNEITTNGMLLTNIMYLELVPSKLKEITFPGYYTNEKYRKQPCALEGTRVVPSRAEGCASEVMTNTENTTENNMKYINQSIHHGEDTIDVMKIYEDIIKDNIHYEALSNANEGMDKDLIDELVRIMVEAVSIERKSIVISGIDYPYQVVKSQFLKLNNEHIEYVIECLRKNTTRIKNIKGYLMTCLYNSANTVSNFYRTKVNHDLYG